MWCFFTKKDRGMSSPSSRELVWSDGGLQPVNGTSCRWCDWEPVCDSQRRDGGCVSVRLRPRAFSRWSGASQGSRGGISILTSVEPITMKGQVQGAGYVCQSACPNKTGVWMVIAAHYRGTETLHTGGAAPPPLFIIWKQLMVNLTIV